jgi:spermidine synthase
MTLDNNWFSEICNENGSAFSLKLAEKLHEEQTEFQKIEIYQTEQFGKLMVIDGFVMLSDRDNFLYHEMMVHPAMFTHHGPKNVLIIGGGDCGTLQQVLNHDSVEQVHQVEIDERVTRLSEKYFPELCAANHDPRAHFHFEDGIRWVRDAEAGCYDIIIIDSTDPIGPAEGLFTLPFYQNCLVSLGDGGILVQQSESPLYHMTLLTAIRKAMKQAGFSDLMTINFPQCVYPSGWWSATMAGKQTDLHHIRKQAIDQRDFATQYYNAEIHQACKAQPEFMLKNWK